MADQEAQTASFPQHTLVPWRVRLCRWLWKVFTFLGVTVILSSLVGIGDVWLTSSKGKIPADSPFGWLISHWLVVLLIGCCCVLIAIMVGILSRGLEQTTPSV